jgi:hypothetical protein
MKSKATKAVIIIVGTRIKMRMTDTILLFLITKLVNFVVNV